MKTAAVILLALIVLTFISAGLGLIERPRALPVPIVKETKITVPWDVTKSEIVSRLQEVVEISLRDGKSVRQELRRWMFDEAPKTVPLFVQRVAGWQLLDETKDGLLIVNLSLSRFPDRLWQKIRFETGINDGNVG